MSNITIKAFSNENYLSLNRDMIRLLGLNVTGFFSELCNEYKYYEANDMLTEEGGFYSTTENIKNNIGLSREQQDTCIKKLTELKIIEIKVKGLPPKRYFKIHIQVLLNLLETHNSICVKDTNRIAGNPLQKSTKEKTIIKKEKIYKKEQNTSSEIPTNSKNLSSQEIKIFFKNECSLDIDKNIEKINQDFEEDELEALTDFCILRKKVHKSKISNSIQSLKIQYNKAKKIKEALENASIGFLEVFREEDESYLYLMTSGGNLIQGLDNWIIDKILKNYGQGVLNPKEQHRINMENFKSMDLTELERSI